MSSLSLDAVLRTVALPARADTSASTFESNNDQTGRQTDNRQTDRQTDRRIDRQTDRKADRETSAHRRGVGDDGYIVVTVVVAATFLVPLRTRAM